MPRTRRLAALAALLVALACARRSPQDVDPATLYEVTTEAPPRR